MAEVERRQARAPLRSGVRGLRRAIAARRRGTLRSVHQTAIADCGAACLAMVLGFFGKELALEEARLAVGSGREGSDALGLLRGARHFGLRARGVKVAKVEDLKHLPQASILHWGFNHFVVLERLTRRGAVLLDPAVGRRAVTTEELGRSFTGVALVFAPGERFLPGPRKGTVFWRYVRRVLVGSRQMPRVVVTSLLVQVLALAIPVLTGLVVDRIVPARDVQLLTVVSLALGAIILFQFAITLVRSHLLVYLRSQLDAEMTLGFVDHLVDLPYTFFQNRAVGDLMLRMNSNATIREMLTSGALSAMLDGFVASSYLVLVLAGDLTLGLLVLGLALARVAVFLLARRRHRELMAVALWNEAESRGYQVQMLSGMETLKSMGAEHRAVEHWSALFAKVLGTNVRRGRLDANVSSLLQTMATASPLIVLAFGAHQVLQGRMSLGLMLALTALAGGFLVPLSALITTAFQVSLLGTYLDRHSEVLEAPREQADRQVRLAPPLRGGVAVEKVSFAFSPAAGPVVRDVSVEIQPGQFVALVGPSGAGKSTLAALMIGLYAPSAGRVLYDGIDLAELDLRSVRRQLGVVPQHPYLFALSIRANVALAEPTASLGRVVDAAMRAHVHDDVVAMPMGYETLLSDGGAPLSGGQRQRVALARALLARPPILLLDEATSALDAPTEREIQREIKGMRCTRIVIAHRISTIRSADLILVMERGEIVERGAFEELLAREGKFAAFVSEQLQGSLDKGTGPE